MIRALMTCIHGKPYDPGRVYSTWELECWRCLVQWHWNVTLNPLKPFTIDERSDRTYRTIFLQWGINAAVMFWDDGAVHISTRNHYWRLIRGVNCWD